MESRPPQRNIQHQSKSISRPSLIRVPPRLAVNQPPDNLTVTLSLLAVISSHLLVMLSETHLMEKDLLKNSLRPRLVKSREKRQKPR